MKRFLLSLIALAFLTCSADAASRFAVCSTTCTWDASDTSMWSASSGGATGASVPGASDTVTLDAATCVGGTTCTITVNTNPTVSSVAIGTCTASTTGCILDFSVNNNNLTAGSFSGTGTGTRQFKMGSGTFTMTGVNGVVWDWTTQTNLTLTPGTSTILISGTPSNQRQLGMGSGTWNNLTISDGSSNTQPVLLSGSPTISGTFTISSNNKYVYFSSATNWTLSALSAAGASTSSPSIMSFVGGTKPTITTTATLSMSNYVIQNVTKAGAGSLSCNPCYDAGGNTSVTITAPASGGGGIIGG